MQNENLKNCVNTFERKSSFEVNTPMQHLFAGKWSKSVEGGASVAVGPKGGGLASIKAPSGPRKTGAFQAICLWKKDEDLFDRKRDSQVKQFRFYCWNSLAGQYLTK